MPLVDYESQQLLSSCRYPEDRVPPRTSFKSKMKGKTGEHAGVSRGSSLLAQGSSGAAMCLVALAPATRARGSSGTAMCLAALAPVSGHRTVPGPPRASWLQLPPPGPTTAQGPPRAPWLWLSSPGTGQLWDCHVPRAPWRELRAIKVNKYLLAARPSWSPSGRACVSSKALRDKDDACKTCGQAGCRPAPAQHRSAARSQ
jgi:hypothetical protein